MGVHFNRYLMWAFPGLLAFVAAGLGSLTQLVAREDQRLERRLFRAGAGLMLLLGGLSTLRFAAVYAELAGETWRREIPMARFIGEHLPRGVAIANAATSIEYLTGHRNLNLHGVTSPAFVGGRSAEREASMLESLGRLRPEELPPYLLLTRSSHEGSELMQALAPGEPLFATTSFGDDLLLFQAHWDLVGRGGAPLLEPARSAIAALERTDGLDVCDPVDEAAHDYRYDSRHGELRLAGSVAIGPAGGVPLADAGRLIFGGESFRVRSRAGRELVIVMRTRSSIVARGLRAGGGLASEVLVPEAGLLVAASGQPALRVTLRERARAGTSTCCGCRRSSWARARRASSCAAATRPSGTGSTSSPSSSARASISSLKVVTLPRRLQVRVTRIKPLAFEEWAAMMTRRLLIGTLLLIPVMAHGQASSPPRPPTFQAGVEVIRLSLSVTDGHNRLITGLSEPDFAVFEDGIRQDLSFFTRERADHDPAGLHCGPRRRSKPPSGGRARLGRPRSTRCSTSP